MQNYETMCVVKSDVQGEKLQTILDKIEKVITSFEGKDVKKNDWGVKKLAYPIQKLTTGHYFLYNYQGKAGVVNELERQLGFEDQVLRYMTVKIEDPEKNNTKPQNFMFGKIDRTPRPRGGYKQRSYDKHSKRNS